VLTLPCDASSRFNHEDKAATLNVSLSLSLSHIAVYYYFFLFFSCLSKFPYYFLSPVLDLAVLCECVYVKSCLLFFVFLPANIAGDFLFSFLFLHTALTT